MLASDKSTDTALKEATKQTMYQSINMGCLRVDEAITIDEVQAKEIFPQKYSSLTNYEDGETDLYIHTMDSVSPMMATEAYQSIDTPIHRAIKSLKSGNELKGKAKTWENSIGIFEATSTIKPPSAEYKGYTNEGNKVDDFQCH
ncbi:hypothetical protein ACMGD3_24180 [Lysinibacillus sphaericus]|uniref:hypothetical protein n=1 Tax=Lysinibacillus sphaericus TaxID=1421 RepID=UPI003F7A150F